MRGNDTLFSRLTTMKTLYVDWKPRRQDGGRSRGSELHAYAKALRAAVAYLYHCSRESKINLPPQAESHCDLPENPSRAEPSHVIVPATNVNEVKE